MKSKVYFVPVTNSEDTAAVVRKLDELLKRSNVLGIVKRGHKTALKIHFGEKGNTGFIRPDYARVVCGHVTAKGATPFLADTNTLYKGRRANSSDHIKLAREHGFEKSMTGADIVIPDENIESDKTDIKTAGQFIKIAKVARFFIDGTDTIIALSHFKGHVLAGFGASLKNIGMGCATREGKLMQHCDVAPVVYKEDCTGCGACKDSCPSGAISIENDKSNIDTSKCIGCAECIIACPTGAMFIDLKSGGIVQKKMVEYAAAVLKAKKGRVGFLNFAIRINKECDCWDTQTPRIAPDVGIFASDDPVSIDKASFDLIKDRCGTDVFKAAHPDQDGMIQLKYAEELGLGSLDYELMELSA